MIWKMRGHRAYAYTASRSGKSVKQRYAGLSMSAGTALAEKRRLAEARRARAGALSAWIEERTGLEERERAAVEADGTFAELADEAMRAAGFHRRNRGPWRKRRGGPDPAPSSALEDLVGRLSTDPKVVEVMAASSGSPLQTELAGPGSGDLDRLLAGRLVAARDYALGRDIAAVEAAGRPPEVIEFVDGLRSRAAGRLVAAATSLAEVRARAIPALAKSEATMAEDKKKIEGPKDEPAPIPLLQRASRGDAAAYEEIRRKYPKDAEFYLQKLIDHRLQARASDNHQNLLLSNSVMDVINVTCKSVHEKTDGPIERILIDRLAMYAAEASVADLEHVTACLHDPGSAERLDRRRDRAHRRLIETLQALAKIRRLNRPSVQVNVGSGNVNVMKT